MGSYRREAGSFLSISVLDYLIGSTVREELDLWFHGYNQGPGVLMRSPAWASLPRLLAFYRRILSGCSNAPLYLLAYWLVVYATTISLTSEAI